MSDERRHLAIAVASLVAASLLFATVVVVLTRTDLDLAGDDPLNRRASDDGEWYLMVKAASDAVRSGRIAEARSLLETAESLSTGDAAALRIGQLYREIGESRAAVRVLAPRGRDAEAATELAGAWLDLGQVDSAAAAFRRAATAGASPSTIRSMAWIALALQDTAGAKALFSRATELFPDDGELWRAFAEIALQGGDVATSARAAAEAIRRAPDSCKAHVAMGWAKEALGDTSGAREAFSEAVRVCPADSLTLFEFGRFHYRGRRDAEALPYLRQATQAAACPVEWLLMRAQVERNLGLYEGARSTLLLAHRRFAGDYRPLLERAKLERWHGDMAEAESLARKAQTLAPNEPSVQRFVQMLG